MESIEIRCFADCDYEGVLRVWKETDIGRPERGDNLETIHRGNEREGVLLVMKLRETQEIIGTSWITNDGRRLYLHHFGILPAYQGKGYAHPLLEESLSFAREKGMQIKLEVHKDNAKALSLYTGSGFTYLGDYRVYIIRDL